MYLRWVQFFFNGTNAMDLLAPIRESDNVRVGSERIHAIRIIDSETKLAEVLTSYADDYGLLMEANGELRYV